MNRQEQEREEMKKIKDKAYEGFTQRQRAHNCPGFDCIICSECFDAAMDEVDAAGYTKEKLVPLDYEALIKFIQEWMFKPNEELRCIETQLAKSICQTFGARPTSSVEEIFKVIERNKWQVANAVFNGEKKVLGSSMELATAIHSLLTKGRKVNEAD